MSKLTAQEVISLSTFSVKDQSQVQTRPAHSDGFEQVWARAESIPGWLTTGQARVLWDEAAHASPAGAIVEIGSHQGRSTVVLAAAKVNASPPVVAIDPFIEGPMLGGMATRAKFEKHIRASGRAEQIRLVVDKSTDVRPAWTEALSLLYIDGKHDYWTVRDDLRWQKHVIAGGRILIHDCFSSVGVTLAVLVGVLPANNLRYLGRERSLAPRFEVGRPTSRDRLRLAAQIPWFLRNLVVKIGLRIARVVGYRGTPDPY